MSTIEDRPTTGERYSSAMESSNLKADADRRGDVDLMIAAGWAPDTLGAMLYRLRHEYEACDMRDIKPLALMPAPDRITRLAEPVEGESAEGERIRMDEHLVQLAAWQAAESARIAKDHAGRLKMAKALALVQLKSLDAVKTELGRLACMRATKERLMQPDSEVLKLVGRVIDVFLDPICHPCGGRGFNGGGRHEESGPQILCRGCRGTGLRRANLGQRQDEKEFAADLLDDIQARMEAVQRMMRRFLSAV